MLSTRSLLLVHRPPGLVDVEKGLQQTIRHFMGQVSVDTRESETKEMSLDLTCRDREREPD